MKTTTTSNVPSKLISRTQDLFGFKLAATGVVMSGAVFLGSVGWNISDALNAKAETKQCVRDGFDEPYARAFVQARDSGSLGPDEVTKEIMVTYEDGTTKPVSFSKIQGCVSKFENSKTDIANHPSRNVILASLGAGLTFGALASGAASSSRTRSFRRNL